MKIWLKYLIAIAVGILAAIIIPSGSIQAQAVLNFLVELSVRFGRYTIVPLLFFSIAMAACNLREEHLMVKTGLWTFGTIIISSLGLTILGLLTALIFKIPRIPITIEKVTDVPAFDIQTLITKIFPYSAFESLADGSYLLPCFVLAGLFGAACASDKVASKPTLTLFDSISRVCYTVMSLFTELLTFGIVAIVAKWSFDLVASLRLGYYGFLILMLLILTLLIAFVFYPLILRFLCHDHRPYKVLFASLSSVIVAFFSGDTNLTLALNYRNGKENLGIRRRINSMASPLFSIFARGGTALVSAICFVVVLRSYSSLGISGGDVFWILGVAFGLSFFLGEIPYGGPIYVITIMCSLYGRGFENGYLLLKDLTPILCSFAAVIDCLTAVFGCYIVGVKTKNIEHQEVKKYI